MAGKLIGDGRRRILKLAQDHPLKHLWPVYRFEVLDYDKVPCPSECGHCFEGRVCPKIEPAKAKTNHETPDPDKTADSGSIWLLIGSQNAKTTADVETTLPNSGSYLASSGFRG